MNSSGRDEIDDSFERNECAAEIPIYGEAPSARAHLLILPLKLTVWMILSQSVFVDIIDLYRRMKKKTYRVYSINCLKTLYMRLRVQPSIHMALLLLLHLHCIHLFEPI